MTCKTRFGQEKFHDKAKGASRPQFSSLRQLAPLPRVGVPLTKFWICKRPRQQLLHCVKFQCECGTQLNPAGDALLASPNSLYCNSGHSIKIQVPSVRAEQETLFFDKKKPHHSSSSKSFEIPFAVWGWVRTGCVAPCVPALFYETPHTGYVQCRIPSQPPRSVTSEEVTCALDAAQGCNVWRTQCEPDLQIFRISIVLNSRKQKKHFL